MIRINGEEADAAGMTVLGYLTSAGYKPAEVAVLLGDVVIPRAKYESTTLSDGDVVEVVTFMGGGRV